MEHGDADGGDAAAVVFLHAGDNGAVGVILEVVDVAVDGGSVEPGVDGDVGRRGEGQVGLTHSAHGSAVDNPAPELVVGVSHRGGECQRCAGRPLADVVDGRHLADGVVGVLHDGDGHVTLLAEDGLHGGVGGDDPLQVGVGALHGACAGGDDPLLEGPVACAFGVEGHGAVLKHVLVEAWAVGEARGHEACAFLLDGHVEVLGHALQHGGEVHMGADGVDMIGVVGADVGARGGVNPLLEGVSGLVVVDLDVEGFALDMLAATVEGYARGFAGAKDKVDVVEGLVHSLDGHVGVEGALIGVGCVGGVLDAVDAPVREHVAGAVVGGDTVEGAVLVAAGVGRSVGVAEGGVGECDGVGSHEVGHYVGVVATYIINSIRVGAAAQARAAPSGEEEAGVGGSREGDAAAVIHGCGGGVHGAGACGVDVGGDGPGLVAELSRKGAVAHHGVDGIGELCGELVVVLVVPAEEVVTCSCCGAEGERSVHAGVRRGVGAYGGGASCGVGMSRHGVGVVGILEVSGVGVVARALGEAEAIGEVGAHKHIAKVPTCEGIVRGVELCSDKREGVALKNIKGGASLRQSILQNHRAMRRVVGGHADGTLLRDVIEENSSSHIRLNVYNFQLITISHISTTNLPMI